MGAVITSPSPANDAYQQDPDQVYTFHINAGLSAGGDLAVAVYPFAGVGFGDVDSLTAVMNIASFNGAVWSIPGTNPHGYSTNWPGSASIVSDGAGGWDVTLDPGGDWIDTSISPTIAALLADSVTVEGLGIFAFVSDPLVAPLGATVHFATYDGSAPIITNLLNSVFGGSYDGRANAGHYDGTNLILAEFMVADSEFDGWGALADIWSPVGTRVRNLFSPLRPDLDVDVDITTVVGGALSTTTYNAIIGGTVQSGWTGTLAYELSGAHQRWHITLRKAVSIADAAIVEVRCLNAKDLAGNTVASQVISRFTVNDADAPTLGATVPADEDVDVALSPAVLVIPLTDAGLGVDTDNLEVSVQIGEEGTELAYSFGTVLDGWSADLDITDIQNATLTLTRDEAWPASTLITVSVSVGDRAYAANNA